MSPLLFSTAMREADPDSWRGSNYFPLCVLPTFLLYSLCSLFSAHYCLRLLLHSVSLFQASRQLGITTKKEKKLQRPQEVWENENITCPSKIWQFECLCCIFNMVCMGSKNNNNKKHKTKQKLRLHCIWMVQCTHLISTLSSPSLWSNPKKKK